VAFGTSIGWRMCETGNMSKTFRKWDVEQRMIFPPTVQDFVPSNHLAHFVRNLVLEQLDLKKIMNQYNQGRGYPPYHPGMMTALILYAYTQGIYASRRIAAACEQRVDFMAVTGMQQPDFRTISDFRKRHLKEIAATIPNPMWNTWKALVLAVISLVAVETKMAYGMEMSGHSDTACGRD